MKSRLVILALVLAASAIFALAIVWPTVALIARCVADGVAPDGGFTYTSRQLGLLWRSLWLAGAATVLCVVVSLPGAFVAGGLRHPSQGPLIAGLFMAALLCPPTVYAFGWERILPSGPFGLDPGGPVAKELASAPRCILVWALWAWPIPAMLIGAGWSRVGRQAYEAAVTVTSATSAFLRVALPSLRRDLLLAGLIVFVLFFGDYNVPHACLLQVFATELLGWAESSPEPVNTVWPSLLSVAVTGVALLAIWVTWGRRAVDADSDVMPNGRESGSRRLAAVAAACLAVSWLLPIGTLTVGLGSPSTIHQAFAIYGTDLAWSLGVAMFSGLAAVAMGLGLFAMRKARTLGLIWALAFGAMPGALIGESLVGAYNHDATWWIYDEWPIVALSYVSRFGWIGILTAMIVMGSVGAHLLDQARADGASETSILTRLQVPLSWPALLCGAGIVAALAVADVAASKLVRVPWFNPVAHILMEKFHRFEDGMLISLSLWLVAATIPPVLLLIFALRRLNSARAGR